MVKLLKCLTVHFIVSRIVISLNSNIKSHKLFSSDTCFFYAIINLIKEINVLLHLFFQKFKFFSSQKYPEGYTDYQNGILPTNIFLPDWFRNMWPIGVTISGKYIYFEYRWECFIEDNILELGYFFTFDYVELEFFISNYFEEMEA